MAIVETKEHYDTLLQKVRSLGDVKRVVNDEVKIKQILAYSGDRHLLCAFFELVNDALNKGKLHEEDLQVFRSGRLMDLIINLEQTVSEVHPRQLFISERLDKINYVGLINDPQTLAASYTHPVIIDALCGKNEYSDDVRDLVWWRDCGTFDSLNSEIKTLIATEVLKNGNPTAALQLLQSASGKLQPCNRETFENRESFKR